MLQRQPHGPGAGDLERQRAVARLHLPALFQHNQGAEITLFDERGGAILNPFTQLCDITTVHAQPDGIKPELALGKPARGLQHQLACRRLVMSQAGSAQMLPEQRMQTEPGVMIIQHIDEQLTSAHEQQQLIGLRFAEQHLQQAGAKFIEHANRTQAARQALRQLGQNVIEQVSDAARQMASGALRGSQQIGPQGRDPAV